MSRPTHLRLTRAEIVKLRDFEDAEMVEIVSSPTGIAPKIEVVRLKFGRQGWYPDGGAVDISDYDSW